ncbi:uncharacterized protein LOC143028759 [Oratosquilla oratoria]|uniref:uncharacterized protein LOC143028759 n=1 Tax=Oratosquilla oratoria TaxID=337810 RepID=UPI003F76B76E
MKTLLLIALLGAAAAAELPSTGYGLPSASASSNTGFVGSFNGGSNTGLNRGFAAGLNGGSSLNRVSGFGTNGGFGGAFNGGNNGRGNGGYSYGPSQEELELLELASNIPGGGVAGEDYPVLAEVPETRFACEDTGYPFGYFADTDDEAGCQVFHVCQTRPNGYQKDSFLCPNGTIFNQQYLVCDWWYNVDCSQSAEFYSVNELIGLDAEALAAASSLSSLYAAPGNGRFVNGINGNGRGGNAVSRRVDNVAAPSTSYGVPS